MDILVNDTNPGHRGKFHEEDLDGVRALVQTNVQALVELTHAFLPDMVRRNEGGIVNVAGAHPTESGPLNTAYQASWAFIQSFSRGLAEELQDTQVTVTAVDPAHDMGLPADEDDAARWTRLN